MQSPPSVPTRRETREGAGSSVIPLHLLATLNAEWQLYGLLSCSEDRLIDLAQIARVPRSRYDDYCNADGLFI